MSVLFGGRSVPAACSREPVCASGFARARAGASRQCHVGGPRVDSHQHFGQTQILNSLVSVKVTNFWPDGMWTRWSRAKGSGARFSRSGLSSIVHQSFYFIFGHQSSCFEKMNWIFVVLWKVLKWADSPALHDQLCQNGCKAQVGPLTISSIRTGK